MADGAHPYKSRPVAGSHVWLTPPEILASLCGAARFDLDPCGHPGWATADRVISPPADGLQMEWHGRVWLNPPFGRHTATWLARMAAHGNGIALVFARTDTRMFRESVWPYASAVMFLHGRPHFYLPDGTRAKGNCGGPICLIAYSNEDARALKTCGLRGEFVRIGEST